MLLNYLNKLVASKTISYEYALSFTEVKKALYEISLNNNLPQTDFDVIGNFISENEFEYNLLNIFDTNGIGITFPMRGTIIPINENKTKIVLKPRSKIYALTLVILSAILIIISLVMFFISGQIKYSVWLFVVLIISPILIRLYLNSVNSALLTRYKKYLHNAILEAYRLKHYGK